MNGGTEMIDWDHKDTVADLREKISTLRKMLIDAHRREDLMYVAIQRGDIVEAYNDRRMIKDRIDWDSLK